MSHSLRMTKGSGVSLLALAVLCVASLNLFEAGAAPARQTAAQPKGNGKIAFTSGRGGDRLDIYLMNPDGSGLVRLTDGDSYNTSPAWSPDGRSLAFVSNRDRRSFAIYLMNADGSNVRRLTNSPEDEGGPAWSPDGSRIAFSRGNTVCIIGQNTCPGQDLFVIDADGDNEKRLTEGRVGDYSPAWSPDGTKIAFSSMRDRNAEIYLMNPDGTGQVNITRTPEAEEWEPTWSPDGARIAFTTVRGSIFDIYSMRADGTAKTNLTNNTSNDIIENPDWSPDGARILFTRFLTAPPAQGQNRDLFVMNADGTEQTRLTTHPDFDVEADWQPLALAPNGPVAYTSERDGNPEVYRMNPDGGAQKNLTSNAARDLSAVWSPDGTRLLFASDRAPGDRQRTQFFVMDADGGGVTQVTNFPDVTDVGFGEPAWSPDGTKIVFVTSSFGAIHSLVVMNADGSGVGRTVAVTSGGTTGVDPAWSPDGTRIAYVGTEDATVTPATSRTYLFVIGADGTGKTKIAEAGASSPSGPFVPLGGPAWSPDGTRLAFASNRDGDAEIFTAAASGGMVERVTDNAAQDTRPSWSPDGRKIVFTSDRVGNQEIYSTEADGSNPTRLTDNAAPDYDPDWASAGARPALPNDFATLQFSDFRYTVPEGGAGGSGRPSLRVVVTRLGDLTREATVDYRTVDLCVETPHASCFHAASERSDFTRAGGRLRFAPGEATRTFDVLFTNDLTVEREENLVVELFDASGAALGGQSRALITIIDDDATPPAGNPIDERRFFVRQHYLDFLSREPDDEGLQFWTGQIPARCGLGTPPADAACLAAREHVSAAFFLSIEFQETGYLAYRTHKTAFGDRLSSNVAGTVPFIRLGEFLTDAQRLGQGVQVRVGDWEQRLDANKNAYMLEFVQRRRFADAYPASLTPAEFVDRLNLNAGGVLSQAERDQLVAEMAAAPDATRARAAALRRVAEDADLRAGERNRAFVLMQYFGYLRRNPDDTPDVDFRGWKFWLDKLNHFGGNFQQAEMVKAFISSDEYRNRFRQ